MSGYDPNRIDDKPCVCDKADQCEESKQCFHSVTHSFVPTCVVWSHKGPERKPCGGWCRGCDGLVTVMREREAE